MSGTQRQQTHPLAGAEDTLKDFWNSRPRRPRRGRKIAGVAAAIANRYSIDPVLVRVVLVVSAFFGGAGLMIYLFGWLFFPEENDNEAPFPAMIGRGRSSTGWFFTLLLCGVLFGVSLWTFNSEGGGLLGAAMLVAALFMLHRSRAGLGQETPPAPQPTMPLPSVGMEMNSPVMPAPPGPEPRNSPPAWDPLGAAPFAWDLPDPAPVKKEPEPPAPRRPRSRVGGITFGAALAVGGALVLLAPQVSWLTPGHITGLVLAVIGLGMVGGSFVRGGRGLIGLAVPLALAGFVFTNTDTGPVASTGRPEWGNTVVRPTSVEAVQGVYSVGGGTVDLDLTALPDTGTVSTSVTVGLGNISVIVPPNADVQVTCDAGLGAVECLGQEQNATDAHVNTVDYGADGQGGLKIYLDARVNSGTVEVRRGN
ncbi:phage shock protein PspC (stress-responsive transcriptional regulator) [Kibdelosporangium banguiense]|uniref:Phage shock protein PspC (Stress-responsive transcriptional regulator) n=1 Tax=Kibdelosporangium banguiense TaxID=1365924 RepID=A0ABS4TDR9_9PSEU|nr:PspC domain-containing protein [Kibdelosporangium banguiense]MBP2322561.1 phage shock protein PspC (stress-responsive transcriptional regulator) [Kibdelosporangium banguiense]